MEQLRAVLPSLFGPLPDSLSLNESQTQHDDDDDDDDDDEQDGLTPCLLGSRIDDDGSHFHVNLSSPKLLQNAMSGYGQDLVILNGTFRVTKEGFCIIVCMTVDAAHHALPISISVTTGERKIAAIALLQDTRNALEKLKGFKWEPQYGLSDHSEAFIAAFQDFGCTRCADCFFHVTRTLSRKAKGLGQSTYDTIKKDVQIIATVLTDEAFNLVMKECFDKWSSMGVDEKFLKAWKKQYYNAHWNCRSLPPGFPTTTAAIEGLNWTIKASWLKRTQKKLISVLPVLKEMLQNWSWRKTKPVTALYPNRRQLNALKIQLSRT